MSPFPFLTRNDSGGSPTPDGGSESRTAEWPKKAVDLVDLVVDLVHDKAVRPVLLVARFVVFGLIVAVLAPAVVVLLSVAIIRILDVYAFGGRVWISDLLVGSIFTLAGFGVWTQRGAPTSRQDGIPA